MNSTPTPPVTGTTRPAATTIVKAASEVQYASRPQNQVKAQPQISPKRAGFGLPCSHCRTYYAADLTTCPVCKSSERVSPKAVKPLPTHVPEPGAAPDAALLEQERERFLREFKAQVYTSHMQINASASFRCNVEAHHPEGFEPAAVCQGCYTRLQERVDVMEAALHIDLQEAAQIVYDAVWADPSDSNKTYENAAQALLQALRQRAGVATVLGSLQPLPH
jgi:hypothetical protein